MPKPLLYRNLVRVADDLLEARPWSELLPGHLLGVRAKGGTHCLVSFPMTQSGEISVAVAQEPDSVVELRGYVRSSLYGEPMEAGPVLVCRYRRWSDLDKHTRQEAKRAGIKRSNDTLFPTFAAVDEHGERPATPQERARLLEVLEAARAWLSAGPGGWDGGTIPVASRQPDGGAWAFAPEPWPAASLMEDLRSDEFKEQIFWWWRDADDRLANLAASIANTMASGHGSLGDAQILVDRLKERFDGPVMTIYLAELLLHHLGAEAMIKLMGLWPESVNEMERALIEAMDQSEPRLYRIVSCDEHAGRVVLEDVMTRTMVTVDDRKLSKVTELQDHGIVTRVYTAGGMFRFITIPWSSFDPERLKELSSDVRALQGLPKEQRVRKLLELVKQA